MIIDPKQTKKIKNKKRTKRNRKKNRRKRILSNLRTTTATSINSWLTMKSIWCLEIMKSTTRYVSATISFLP